MNFSKPNIQNRKEFSIWLCKAHNEVNNRLGKKEFDCNRVLERWAGIDDKTGEEIDWNTKQCDPNEFGDTQE